jgi:hypothetical protein
MPGVEIRAHRRGHVRAQRGDRPVLRRRELVRGDVVAPVDGGEVVLRALLDPLHRHAETPREGGGEELLGVDVQLGAEAAADVGSDHAHLGLVEPERRREQEPQDVRDLRGRPDGQVAVRLGPGEHRARLHRVRDQPRLDVAAAHRHVGRREGGVDIAGVELPRVALVRADRGVDERRALPQRVLDVDHDRERLVVHLDELGRVPGGGGAGRDDDRDRVSLVARLVERERPVLRVLHVLGDGPGARHRRLPVLAQVGSREDRDHAGGAPRGVEPDAPDACVRVGAAHERHVERAGQAHVARVAPATRQQRTVLLARNPRPDEAGRAGLGGGHHDTPAAAFTASTMLW